MEVADEGSNDREVLGVQSNRTGFPLCWDRWVILGAEDKPPNFGADGFAAISEDGGVILDKDCDSHFYKHNSAFIVT